MPQDIQCDLAIIGGGLAGGLIALALAARRPEVDVLLVEADTVVGGNHIWSFFASDVDPADRWLVDPLVGHRWPAYDIAFPKRKRRLDEAYHSIRSERLDTLVRAALPPARLLTGIRATDVSPTAATLADGTRIAARAVIDARGAGDLSTLDLGWQKFVGLVVRTDAPHGRTHPVVMDATVEQIDGYRFVYVLPFGPDRLLIEDTYYSDSPDLDRQAITARVHRYAADHGWGIAEVEHSEAGVLPVALGGDFDGYWASGGAAAKAGVRAGLFHPTTGYSLPDAVRLATHVAALPDPAAPDLAAATRDRARETWAGRGFYRLLDRMLFRAAEPAERYKVLERFYGLDAGLVGRFYAGRSTLLDKLRILSGKPPVPLMAALRVLKETRGPQGESR
ncbi:lycopene beta-cyclase CrtY [Sphingomonas solaris]|uniref:Lycopene beta-cyclase CrtY n=1 Tax=Alterirhizorhabdus solaris TaxID=2529389 RepID=A0A558QSI0_9SPHN|nr:lycopene beta-cyclase CrtY [Sphingomonas solaris]TVV70089.1 lycopene beta-cyclase CrtY [Sphingomonas solaris]